MKTIIHMLAIAVAAFAASFALGTELQKPQGPTTGEQFVAGLDRMEAARIEQAQTR